MELYRLIRGWEMELVTLDDLIKNARNDAERAALEKKRGLLFEKIERIDNALDCLDGDPVYRVLFLKRYIQGKTWEQVAEEMGYSASHVFRLRSKMLFKLACAMSGMTD